MLFHKILPLIILPNVLSYYFYNPRTHDLLTLPSLSKIPPGYKLLPPPKNNGIHSRIHKGKRNGVCTDAGFTCTTPFRRSITYQFECDEDHQCPASYKCCQQKCFLHKICSKTTQSPTNANGNCDRPGGCEKWPYNCLRPYHYSLTSMFKCSSDRECPRGFKCCAQNCFLHKICSRVVARVVPLKPLGQPTSRPDIIANFPLDEDLYVFQTESNLNGGEEQEVQEVQIKGEEGVEDEKEEDVEEKEEEDVEEEEEEDVEEDVEDKEEANLGGENGKGEEENIGNTYNNITKDKDSTFTVNLLDVFLTKATTETNNGEGDDNNDGVNLLHIVSNESATQDNVRLIAANETTFSTATSAPVMVTRDSNAIIPEYSAYYYHYDDENDTTADYDDIDEDEFSPQRRRRGKL